MRQCKQGTGKIGARPNKKVRADRHYSDDKQSRCRTLDKLRQTVPCTAAIFREMFTVSGIAGMKLGLCIFKRDLHTLADH
jgi:hypothetical protein